MSNRFQEYSLEQPSAKPFVKWAGGKRQILSDIETRIPPNFLNYHETFVGGGALFYFIQNKSNESTRCFLNDINHELVNTYRVVRDSTRELIKNLHELERNHSQQFFYEIRARDRALDFESVDDIERAARFIYLNKTAFNGLYRVNAKNQFNVPYGAYARPNICDQTNLFACSKALQNTVLLCGDFSQVLEHVQPRDFVYLDPPYIPMSETASFTSYTCDSFSIHEHLRLRELCVQLDELNVYFLLSNSDTKITRDIYEGFLSIESIPSRRSISAKISGRANVSELLVRNYA